MKSKITNRRLLIFIGSALVLAIISDFISESELKYRFEARSFENKLHHAWKEGRDCMAYLADNDTMFSNYIDAESRIKGETFSLFRYTNGKLSAWTDNSYDLPDSFTESMFRDNLLYLSNRWVIAHKLKKDDDIYICLIDLYRDYSLQNEYLQNGFNPQFELPVNTVLSTDENKGYPVYDIDGSYLFSLVFDKEGNFLTVLSVIPVASWVFFSLLFLLLVDRMASWLKKKGFKYIAFFSSLQAVIIFYLVFIMLDGPGIFTRMDLFASFRFELGPLVPSPGHLMVLSVLFLFVCIEFYRYFPAISCTGYNYFKETTLLSVFFSVAALVFYIYSSLLKTLILDSNIHFHIHEILDIDIFTVFTFLSSAMIFAGAGIYLLKVVRFCEGLSMKKILPALLIPAILLYIPGIVTGDKIPLHSVAFILTGFQAWFFRLNRSRLINIAVSFAIIAAAYSTFLIPRFTWAKESEKLKVISVNFSNVNDIYGESLLIELWPDIKDDSTLRMMMEHDFMDSEQVTAVYSYLDEEYFAGYWDNYEKVYTICGDDSPLYFESDTGRVENCFEFFRNRAETMGVTLTDSNLLFLDNKSGRPFYLGCLYYDKPDGGRNGLFIELINLVRYTESGYPELLIDKRFNKQANTEGYPVGKYVNDSLVFQTGDYPFDNHLSIPVPESQGFHEVKDDDIEYFVYADNDVTVTIARSHLDFMDIVVTFAYLFITFFILYLLIVWLMRPPENLLSGRLNFTQKLQVAFVGMLLGSMVAIGTVVVILSIKQYRVKHYENIEEKLGSVYIELDHKLSQLDSLDREWSTEDYPDLDALLVKFSNVFKTDINLYNTDGRLMATSRREVFERGLKSERMSFGALTRLKEIGESQVIHNERIGRLEYLSAYMPFLNHRNEVMVYLNLPYFNMQSRISEETSNLIVTMINFSMILLVISLGIAVFISVRITNPLRMLQQGLASVRLEEKSKPLEYKGHDEISELVKQYNNMLDELQNSAVKLARSEREDAWREMAKQIAHEIKNPLTPMKLNVQQLYRKYIDRPEDFGDTLKSFMQNQIEQIDNLSSIATEFSSFARMPKASPRETDLVGHISAVAELYSDIKNISLNINLNGLKEVKVYADKEQIHSMLSNLFRNAVQAIPGAEEGRIDISLSVLDGKALISIRDNGVGIPEKLREKLFMPNFTTKSSGMGLGLAIVKRIVETANGNIWFESEQGKGTIFFIEYPLLSYSR